MVGVTSTLDGGSRTRRPGTAARQGRDDGGRAHAMRALRALDPLVGDLLLQLDDAVDHRLGPRRAAGDEHVDRHDLIEPWTMA